jgi:hypothetical protein
MSSDAGQNGQEILAMARGRTVPRPHGEASRQALATGQLNLRALSRRPRGDSRLTPERVQMHWGIERRGGRYMAATNPGTVGRKWHP